VLIYTEATGIAGACAGNGASATGTGDQDVSNAQHATIGNCLAFHLAMESASKGELMVCCCAVVLLCCCAVELLCYCL